MASCPSVRLPFMSGVPRVPSGLSLDDDRTILGDGWEALATSEADLNMTELSDIREQLSNDQRHNRMWRLRSRSHAPSAMPHRPPAPVVELVPREAANPLERLVGASHAFSFGARVRQLITHTNRDGWSADGNIWWRCRDKPGLVSHESAMQVHQVTMRALRQLRESVLSTRQFYIGITENPARRWEEHCSSATFMWSHMEVLVAAESYRTTSLI